MKLMRLAELPDNEQGHFLEGVVPGRFLARGGLSFQSPGARTHTDDGPGGRDYHVHDDAEVFIILQGKARMEVDGTMHPLTTGDVCIIEAGEDHHLIADEGEPCVNLWLHAGEEHHPNQQT